MKLSRRDWFATAMVALETLMAALWAMDAALPGLEGVRATGVVYWSAGSWRRQVPSSRASMA